MVAIIRPIFWLRQLLRQWRYRVRENQVVISTNQFGSPVDAAASDAYQELSIQLRHMYVGPLL